VPTHRNPLRAANQRSQAFARSSVIVDDGNREWWGCGRPQEALKKRRPPSITAAVWTRA
jgi:hypothetical protein